MKFEITTCNNDNCISNLFHWRLFFIQFHVCRNWSRSRSETDSQQFLLPIIMPLMLGVYIGFFTVINDLMAL